MVSIVTDGHNTPEEQLKRLSGLVDTLTTELASERASRTKAESALNYHQADATKWKLSSTYWQDQKATEQAAREKAEAERDECERAVSVLRAALTRATGDA